jgi:hypothetical protein
MTTEVEGKSAAPVLPTAASSIEVQLLPSEEHLTNAPETRENPREVDGVPSEPTEIDAPRKHQKRRSGNSVDLTYRYYEPSDDELSWTEDEHGRKKRRKSKKRKSGGGDDFRNGIMFERLKYHWW